MINRVAALHQSTFVRSLAAGALLTMLSNTAAHAHVKWFCAYDVAGQPRGLENILCTDFELLVIASILFLVSGCYVESTPLGSAALRAMDRATVWVRENSELLMRATCGFFFVALWTLGGVILTPELKTTSPAIPLIQLAIAAGMISRATLPLSAAGIVFLFGVGVWNYGAFHLADYPIFLSVAAYLVLTAVQRDVFGVRAVDVIRYGAAITLMWASIEKWAYPQWSFPLFMQHPNLTLGFDPEFYMRAAGIVEFALAFALLWTPLVRRFAAVILCGAFISACFEFGKIDVIGHSAIIAVLFLIIADDKKAAENSRVLRPVFVAPAFTIALVGYLALYYEGHALMFKSPGL